MFPNGLGVYFHDTPSSDLLAKPGRHFTNACVRLEDAQSLGRGFFGKTLQAEGSEPEQLKAKTPPSSRRLHPAECSSRRACPPVHPFAPGSHLLPAVFG